VEPAGVLCKVFNPCFNEKSLLKSKDNSLIEYLQISREQQRSGPFSEKVPNTTVLDSAIPFNKLS